MIQNKLMITNIQRMCFHDGPGIRTTVFTKGCTLHCPWCSNPENLSSAPEFYEKDGVKGVYGQEYTAEELVKILLRDRDFWGEDGGVTFSGGEALLQADALRGVLELLKDKGVHTAVETALFVPEMHLEKIIPYVDCFIVDVKILDRTECRSVLGGDISVYLKNVEILCEAGKIKLFRVPCCPEYTFTEENKKRLLEFFKKFCSSGQKEVPVQLFEIHGLGEKKYESLKRPMWKSEGIEETYLHEYKEILMQEGIEAEIIHI